MKSYNELQLAKELIKFPTVTPNDAGIINYLVKILKPIGFDCKVLEFKSKDSKKVKNLYAKLGKSSPNFCFAGHTDVVPPGNLKNWKTNPFKPKIINKFLIGRGASDMKSSIACFVAAVSKIESNKLKGSISLLITGDEEGDAINGTKKVVEYLIKKKEKINFCIVGEPTNRTKLGEMLKIGRRGSITGDLIIRGTQGHVAYPNEANNPVSIITKILSEIKNIKFDKGSKNFQPTNLEVVKINVNNLADNVIPGEASAKFNIRFNNLQSSKKIKKTLKNVFNKICKKNKCTYQINYKVSGESFLTKPDKTTKMIQKTIKDITKINPKMSTTGGTSDARFIRKISPCIEFGLVGKTMHKVGECVSLSDLKRLTLIYTKILDNYFK